MLKKNTKTLIFTVFILFTILGSSSLLRSDSPDIIIRELYSSNKETRLEALDKLNESPLFWAMERLVQVLITDIDDDMRLKACEILSEKIDPITIPSFTYKINDKNIFVRLCAITALRQFIDDYPIETLIERLAIEDNDIYGVNKEYYEINLTSHHNVRKEIIKTIATITEKRKRSLLRDRIIELFKSQYNKEEDWGVRIEILESVVKLKKDEGFELLKKALREESELYVIDYIVRKLWDIGRGAFADKILTERKMKENKVIFDPKVNELSDEELVKYVRIHRIDYISALLYHSDYRKRLDAVRKLGLIANGEIIEMIENTLLYDESIDVRKGCIIVLAKCGDEHSAKFLINAFYDVRNEILKTDIMKALSKLGVERGEY